MRAVKAEVEQDLLTRVVGTGVIVDNEVGAIDVPHATISCCSCSSSKVVASAQSSSLAFVGEEEEDELKLSSRELCVLVR